MSDLSGDTRPGIEVGRVTIDERAVEVKDGGVLVHS
jgi:hypothetical protein